MEPKRTQDISPSLHKRHIQHKHVPQRSLPDWQGNAATHERHTKESHAPGGRRAFFLWGPEITKPLVDLQGAPEKGNGIVLVILFCCGVNILRVSLAVTR